MTKIYLAGPMSNIPQFNFPAFAAAAADLRAQGWEVVSPAEEDYKYGVGEQAERSADGDPSKLRDTWGTILARDVKLIADSGIDGIVFLPGWRNSRGAKLEAFVGLLQERTFLFWDYIPGAPPRLLPRLVVLSRIYISMEGL